MLLAQAQAIQDSANSISVSGGNSKALLLSQGSSKAASASMIRCMASAGVECNTPSASTADSVFGSIPEHALCSSGSVSFSQCAQR